MLECLNKYSNETVDTNKTIAAEIIKIFVLISRIAITVKLWWVHAFVDRAAPSEEIGCPQIFKIALWVPGFFTVIVSFIVFPDLLSRIKSVSSIDNQS